MPGRPAGAVCDNLFKNHTEAGGATTARRFAVEGARSVVIIWKADSGTPTMTIGAYVHSKSARNTTLTDYDLVAKGPNGATVAAGQCTYIYPSAAAADIVTPAAEVPLGIMELDVSAAGNVTNLDVKTIVLY